MIIVLMAACTLGYARIGETLVQCEKRYGKLKILTPKSPEMRSESPIVLDVKIYMGIKNNFKIILVFNKNKCHLISLTKFDNKNIAVQLTGNEIRTLLNANKLDEKWRSFNIDDGKYENIYKWDNDSDIRYSEWATTKLIANPNLGDRLEVVTRSYLKAHKKQVSTNLLKDF